MLGGFVRVAKVIKTINLCFATNPNLDNNLVRVELIAMKYLSFIVFVLLFARLGLHAQESEPVLQNTAWKKFAQLESELPTPNTYRTASGAPGHEYWQQKADYDIAIELDDDRQQISGTETITYSNRSPDVLTYLWLQLDQNLWDKDNDTHKTETQNLGEKVYFGDLSKLHPDFDGGFELEWVRGIDDRDLPHTINKTMMRVDLPIPLKPGEQFSFKVKWWYKINDRIKIGGRSGYEYFATDKNYLYTIAQFYPRMALYGETTGWQHKQFLGRSEFTLSFGDYRVRITAPADHIIAATGELQNPDEVLSAEQKKRFEDARKQFDKPTMIVTESEAKQKEQGRSKDKKTWIFEAKNVRDFAFASSRKFIWDAMGVQMSNRTVMAMSYYPKEGNPLWEQYSTKAVAHTLKTYSKHTFDYPYPVAISVHADRIGMEYPMICFNFGRPDTDGTYSARTKYGMIGVIIHEVGHNYFPMIVNSDERQWTWMDEGLNSFLEYIAEQEWETNYPSRRGSARSIVDYMKGNQNQLEPVMTSGESLIQVGNNAYGKVASALNILRETIMGRELFDFAFKQYAQRWMFKHPNPADFFRTMEDASAVDLDWFWRGWFYSTEPCDIAIERVRWLQPDTRNPETEKPLLKAINDQKPVDLSTLRNQQNKLATAIGKDPSLRDFYNDYDKYKITSYDKEEYDRYWQSLNENERILLQGKYQYYEIKFKNVGGLIMPIILEFEFVDGSKELKYIPAEVWRLNDKEITKIFPLSKEVRQISLDPYLETADINLNNNYYPPRMQPTRFQLYKGSNYDRYGGQDDNPMKKQKKGDEPKMKN